GRLRRTHQSLRRRDGAHRPLSGSACPPTPRALVRGAWLGDADRKEKRGEARQGGARPQTRCRPASHVGRWYRLPLDNPGASPRLGRLRSSGKNNRFASAYVAVNECPDGYEGWTSTHRWLLPIGNANRVRRRAWP